MRDCRMARGQVHVQRIVLQSSRAFGGKKRLQFSYLVRLRIALENLFSNHRLTLQWVFVNIERMESGKMHSTWLLPLDKKKLKENRRWSVRNDKKYMWLSKEDCMSNVKRPQLRYLLTNTSLHQPVETFSTWAAPFSITLFDQPPRVFFFWKWFIEKVFSYCRLLTFRSTQKRNWTFFLRVILTRKRSVERKAPKLDADRSWWLINLLAIPLA